MLSVTGKSLSSGSTGSAARALHIRRKTMHNDAKRIIDAALRDAMPGAAVRQALEKIDFNPEGRLIGDL